MALLYLPWNWNSNNYYHLQSGNDLRRGYSQMNMNISASCHGITYHWILQAAGHDQCPQNPQQVGQLHPAKMHTPGAGNVIYMHKFIVFFCVGNILTRGPLSVILNAYASPAEHCTAIAISSSIVYICVKERERKRERNREERERRGRERIMGPCINRLQRQQHGRYKARVYWYKNIEFHEPVTQTHNISDKRGAL